MEGSGGDFDETPIEPGQVHYHYEPRTPLPLAEWSKRLGEPSRAITRKVFIIRIQHLLSTFEKEHEEMTGVTSDEKMVFEEWCDELRNAHDNTF